MVELFWVWFPDARSSLNQIKVFNGKFFSNYLCDHMLNSRRFNSTIYKEENVCEDKVKDYIYEDASKSMSLKGSNPSFEIMSKICGTTNFKFLKFKALSINAFFMKVDTLIVGLVLPDLIMPNSCAGMIKFLVLAPGKSASHLATGIVIPRFKSFQPSLESPGTFRLCTSFYSDLEERVQSRHPPTAHL